jgi:aspartate-semialdehyde dehydrogenase
MRKSQYNVAIIGATGTVGRELVAVLDQRGFPLGSLRLFASAASAGEENEVAGVRIEELTGDTRLKDTDLVFLACQETVARVWRSRALEAGAFVIDLGAGNAGAPSMPLVVPEVNAAALARVREGRLVGSPDPAAIALAVVLGAVSQIVAIRDVVATVLDPVSLAGRQGIEVLEQELYDLLNGREPAPPRIFSQRIAFNVVPDVGGGTATLETRGEQVLREHVRLLLGDPGLPVHATRVQVPVFFGLSIAADLRLARSVTVHEIESHLQSAPGILLVASGGEVQGAPLPLPTPATVIGSDATHVARVRVDPEVPSVACWLAIDNTRKGSATNAVQIAELLVRDYL